MAFYAEELEKIKEQDPYGEYYDENINNVHKTSAQIIEKGNPDVITKEPSVDEEDTSRQNDQEIIVTFAMIGRNGYHGIPLAQQGLQFFFSGPVGFND